MGKLYKFGYCAICKRQLIIKNVNGMYVCDFCKRGLKKEQRDKLTEYRARELGI